MTTNMEAEKLSLEKDWILERITIEYVRYGDDKGKYKGRIAFQNGEFEMFSFNLKPELTQPYLDLISNEIVKSSNELTVRLLEQLKLSK